MSDDAFFSIWSRIFDMTGRSGRYTDKWECLPEVLRRAMEAECPLRPDERPFLASVQSSSTWFVLTTNHLFWKRDGIRVKMRLDSLKAVAMDFHALAESRRFQKTTTKEMSLEDFNGEISAICVEAGPPFDGIWNVLMNVCARNRERRTAEQ